MISVHEHRELIKSTRRNKWALGYIACITTTGLVIKFIEIWKG